MTKAIPYWFSLLLACFVLTGCSLPLLNRSAAAETELFAQGLDQYLASGDLTTLKLLPQEYPQGAWRSKAEGLVDMAEEQSQQQARLKKRDNEVGHCQKEKALLAQDKQILEATLEQLKQVLIDMELRTN